jgi:hypothetical protein
MSLLCPLQREDEDMAVGTGAEEPFGELRRTPEPHRKGRDVMARRDSSVKLTSHLPYGAAALRPQNP